MKGKKILERCMAALLTVAMITGLAGCGATEESKINEIKSVGTEADNGTGVTAKGRYMETQLSTFQDFEQTGNMTRLSDGSIVVLNYASGIRNVSTDQGESWTGETVPEIEAILYETNELDGAVAPDGGIFVSYIVWDDSSEEKLYPEKYIYLAADGTKTEFELGLEDYKTSITKSVFSTDGRLFGVTDYKVYEIDLQNQTAEFLFELNGWNDLAMCASSTQLVVQDGETVYFYNLESGELTMEDAVLNSFVEEQTGKMPGIVLCNATGEKEDSSLYLASVGGIYHHIIGGSVMEQLADGTLNNLSDPTRTPIGMLQLSEESFLILYQNGELYSYVYDPEAPAVPEEQITIYGLYDNETVRRAINVFRKENPDVFVKFEIGLTGEDGITENDAIRNLNTRLLAGDGPDLLLLNGMPIDSYVEKGILVDLSGEADAWKSQTTFFEGILEGYRQEEGLFAVPFRYNVPVIGGEETEIATIQDLTTLAGSATRIADSGQVKISVLATYTAEELLEKLYPLCADAWVTQENAVNEEALQEFLSDAKQIYAAEQRNLTEEMKQEYAESTTRLLNYYSEEELQKRRMGIDSQATDQVLGTQMLAAGYLYSMEDYRTLVSVQDKYEGSSENYQFRLWNGQNSNVFCPTGIVGLCTNAKNPEVAKAFLATLLQEEVQKVDLGDGFPVNKDAFKIFTADPNTEPLSVAFSDAEGNYMDLTFRWPDNAEIEELSNIISMLDTPAGTDKQMKENVISVGAKALTGEKEIDECVEEIVQKISLQLQE